ncbi:uncharacterized protein LOC129594189 [Paramacrobiotus metropolitanus]|uniref:uncharacterized protein LOC129594189 n=1 Tax=Paramacrobiotus metropolitanus TaxID=2943436 RepID=UPI0024463F96|nr:uncharacterized protein LOC129594189 [Paramacrobiotus metropolitanus]
MIDLEAGGDGPHNIPNASNQLTKPLQSHFRTDHPFLRAEPFTTTPASSSGSIIARSSITTDSLHDPNSLERLPAHMRVQKRLDFSPSPPQPSTPQPLSDTVYVRDNIHEGFARRFSEDNGETVSLLSNEDREPKVLPEVRTREQEHQLLLEAMQKRFVCPNFAAPPVVNVGSHRRTSQDAKASKTRSGVTGHTSVLASDKVAEIDGVVSRLDEAFHEKKAPFDPQDNLLEKLGDVQRKQLLLNSANLEMSWSKNVLNTPDHERGTRFRENLAAFHEMMDELSREVLILQNIDPADASDTLPRRRQSDLPDLVGLHAQLFRSHDIAEVANDLQSYVSDTSTVNGTDAGRTVRPFPTRSFPVPHPQVVPNNLRQPPPYPPPPVPSVINST